MDEAVAAGLEGLRLLGLRMSASPSRAGILRELAMARRAQGRRRVAELADAPVITDPDVLLSMRILVDFIPPAYLTGNDRLFAAGVLKQVRLSLENGVCAEAAAAYASYVVLLAGLGKLRGAKEFAQLALRLTDTFNAVDSRCRNIILCALFGSSWDQPWSELRAVFQEACARARSRRCGCHQCSHQLAAPRTSPPQNHHGKRPCASRRWGLLRRRKPNSAGKSRNATRTTPTAAQATK
jgi:predicted ATPase